MYEKIEHFTGFDISTMDENQSLKLLQKMGVEVDGTMGGEIN